MPAHPAPAARPHLSPTDSALLEWLSTNAQAGGGSTFQIDARDGEPVLVIEGMIFPPLRADGPALYRLAARGLVQLHPGGGRLTDAGAAYMACVL